MSICRCTLCFLLQETSRWLGVSFLTASVAGGAYIGVLHDLRSEDLQWVKAESSTALRAQKSICRDTKYSLVQATSRNISMKLIKSKEETVAFQDLMKRGPAFKYYSKNRKQEIPQKAISSKEAAQRYMTVLDTKWKIKLCHVEGV